MVWVIGCRLCDDSVSSGDIVSDAQQGSISMQTVDVRVRQGDDRRRPLDPAPCAVNRSLARLPSIRAPADGRGYAGPTAEPLNRASCPIALAVTLHSAASNAHPRHPHVTLFSKVTPS